MKQRYLEIDGIRGILCVLILLHHLDSITNAFTKNQACLAVEIFVCLAGFMMAYNYKDKISNINFYEYFSKRYFKIMPLYWLTLVCMFLWDSIIYLKSGKILFRASIGESILQFTGFYTGWFTDAYPLNFPLWTVCCLLLCYFVYFVICKISKESDDKYITVTIILLIVAVSIWKYLNSTNSVTFIIFTNSAYRAIIGFLIGLLLYEIHMRIKDSNVGKIIAVLLDIILVVSISICIYAKDFLIMYNYDTIFTCFFICPLIIFNSLYISFIKRILSSKLFVFLGTISMSIYMWHGVVISIIGSNFFKQRSSVMVYSISNIMLAVLLGIISHFYIEPLLNRIFVCAR